MALAYLLCVAVSLVVLAVVLFRSHPAPVPPKAPAPPATAALPPAAEVEIRLILAAVTQLATRLTPAA